MAAEAIRLHPITRWSRSSLLAVFLLLLLEACGGRPIVGWTSYWFEQYTEHPSVWTTDGAPIWVYTGEFFRVEGESVQEEPEPLAALDGVAIRDVYGTAPDDVWFDCGVHFDGAGWRFYNFPSASFLCHGMSLYGAARDRYFEVLLPGTRNYVEWDGATWQERGFASAPHEEESLPTVVHGSGPGDVHMGGRGDYLSRFDGRDWHTETAPLPIDVYALWVRSPVEAYAAGSRPPLGAPGGTVWPADRGLLLRWDGSRWRQIPSPTTDALSHLTGDGDYLFAATTNAVLERNPQGHWSTIFEVAPEREIKKLRFGGGLLMVCESGSNTDEGIKLWVRR